MSKVTFFMLGTSTNVEVVDKGKAEVELLLEYERGETLTALYRRRKGKEQEDQFILNGPDGLGGNVKPCAQAIMR